MHLHSINPNEMKKSILFKLPLALILLASYNNISQQKSNEAIYLAKEAVHMDKTQKRLII